MREFPRAKLSWESPALFNSILVDVHKVELWVVSVTHFPIVNSEVDAAVQQAGVLVRVPYSILVEIVERRVNGNIKPILIVVDVGIPKLPELREEVQIAEDKEGSRIIASTITFQFTQGQIH